MRKKIAELPAYQQAMGLLVRREHSRRELKQKLRLRGKENEEIEAALETLSRQDFQNDERFAMALARSRQAAGYGPVRIRAEMAQHSLGSELITQTIQALPGDWLQTAQGLIQRRYRQKINADASQGRKAVDFLLRRGFDQKTAFQAVKLGECSEDADFLDESP
jgi:regulatory protein